jgi:hypothetical protein
MQAMYERCAGLDVPKKTVVAIVWCPQLRKRSVP